MLLREALLAPHGGSTEVRARAVRRVCVENLHGQIPEALRADVWEALLLSGGGETKEDSDDDILLLERHISHAPLTLKRQRVVKADAERTRPEYESLSAALIERLLTFYCVRKSINYKQGLNEVLAPFALLRSPSRLSDGAIYVLFERFVERFLPHMYSGDDYIALQIALRAFQLLLTYHDAELGSFLSHHRITPEIYATPIFLTYFARNVPLEVLYAIWDAFLLADDHLVDLHIYFSVAFIIYNRRAILSTRDGSDLPLVLTTLNIRSASTVSSVFKSAAGLHAATPYAFAERVRDMLYCPPDPPTRKQLNVLESSSCVTVDGEDVIRGMYRAPYP